MRYAYLMALPKLYTQLMGKSEFRVIKRGLREREREMPEAGRRI